MVQMALLYLLTIQTIQVHVVSSLADTSYIARIIDGGPRRCIRTYDCPPGHEILPCTVEFTREECEKCPEGFVQPDVTSSSKNQSSFKCFKPQGECGARDVKNSRTPNTDHCRFNRYCKCNTDACYHGDPCTCQKRQTPCGVGETMNQSGDCVPCPEGTEKKEKGCGHCKRILTTAKFNTTSSPPTTKVVEHTSSLPTSSSATVVSKVDRREKVKTEFEETTARPHTTENEIISIQLVPDHVKQSIVKEDSYSTLMTGMWVLTSLVALIITVFAVGLVLCRRRNKLKKDAEYVLYEHRQLLPTQIQGDIIQEQEENKNNPQLMRQNGNIPSVSFTDSCSGISDSNDTGSLNSSKDGPVLASTPTRQNMEENEEHNKSLISQEQYEDPTSSLQMDISKVVFEDKVVPPPDTDDATNLPTYLDIQSGNSKDIISQYQKQTEQQNKDVVYTNSSKLDDLTSTNSQNTSSTLTGYTQVTDVCSSPVVQETHLDITNYNKEHHREAIEHSITNSIPRHSPMSDADTEQKHQEYGHLVSATDRSTTTIVSGLEFHNFDMVGTKTLSVSSQDTENKQRMTELDIDIENNDRQN